MKHFSIWLAIALSSYAVIAAGWHFYLQAHPHDLAVVVDASYPMQADWARVQQQLQQLNEQRYTRFALATEKGLQHSWDSSLNPARITPYAPRDLSRLKGLRDSLPELQEADKVVVITNAPPEMLEEFDNWVIQRP